MSDDPLESMQRRAEQCRRLAEMISSETARAALLQMADEIEIDIKRLEAEREARDQ